MLLSCLQDGGENGRVSPPPHPWNVLLITADTTRQDDLGCYGGPVHTPALNALADDGVLFHDAYSVAYGTTPSHASLLTGKHAAEHHVYSNKAILDAYHLTLAEVLDAKGYATAAFVSSVAVSRSRGFGQGFHLFDDAFRYDATSVLVRKSNSQRTANVTTDLFLTWLKKQRLDRPFFAWIHYFDPHQPYTPPAEYTDPKHAAVLAAYPDLRQLFREADGTPRVIAKHDKLSSMDADKLSALDTLARSRYRGEITFLDSQVGRVLDALRDGDLYQNTLIVFVADHGENFLNRGSWLAFDHAGLFSDVTRLPLIIKLPNSALAGTARHFLVGNLDIMPTILEVLGVAMPEGGSGRGFLPHLMEPQSTPFRDHLILEGAHEHEVSVRTLRWMYREVIDSVLAARIQNGRPRLGYEMPQSSQLYDLTSDRGETVNLVGEETHRPTVSQFRSITQNFLAAKGNAKANVIESPEHLEALRALGYLD